MLMIAGIVPLPNLPLITDFVSRQNDQLLVDGHLLPCGQGTAAMISAALKVTEYMGLKAPYVVLAGDIGSGKRSSLIYQYLIDTLTTL